MQYVFIELKTKIRTQQVNIKRYKIKIIKNKLIYLKIKNYIYIIIFMYKNCIFFQKNEPKMTN